MSLAMLNDTHATGVAQWLSDAGIPFRENFSLARISQIKAGGTPRLFVQPQNMSLLCRFLAYLKQHSIGWIVIGNLSNLLIRSGELNTIVISLKEFRDIDFMDGYVCVGAGVLLPVLAREMETKGYAGFSGLYGVPGSIGGGIFMNASCYGNAVSDYLIDVTFLTEDGDIRVLKRDELSFSWRKSAFHDRFRRCIIVEARFSLIKNEMAVDKLKLTDAHVNRSLYQESAFPNLGSLFATRNIYGEIASHFPVYRALLLCIRIVLHLMPGDRHANFARLATSMTRWYFDIRDTDKVGLSGKTINCVINKGGAEADEIVGFVRNLQGKLQNCVPLEIEIIDRIE
ncbi:FAD-binding protein [Paludibacterium yongneupense]|uniref:FAD-binding protein n=1 Tax=Paludibacterium yongneupense TaxID=400061 RepID=UPI00146C9EE2|nr:FAD-binding protein [Paludibacterium yongneupense]